jgi:hypothetical protein
VTAITSADVPWDARQRIESLAGEARVNVIRLAAVFAFYLRHTIAMLASPAGPEAGRYHLGATCVAAAWFAAVVAIHLCIARRYLPPWLKYAACAFDLLMVTMLGILRADPRSPIVLLYFPVIVSAALRMSLGLIYFATAGAAVGYLAALANYAWYVVGADRYYATPTIQIPRGDEALFLLALIATGVFAGQLVRQARRLTIPYPVTIAPAPSAPSAGSERPA